MSGGGSYRGVTEAGSCFCSLRLPKADLNPPAPVPVLGAWYPPALAVPRAAFSLWRENKIQVNACFFSPDRKGFACNPLLYVSNVFHMS